MLPTKRLALSFRNDGRVSRYFVRNNVLYIKFVTTGESIRLQCYVPKGHRLSLLRVFHYEHNHPGVNKTCDLVMKRFWFGSWEKSDVPFENVHMAGLGLLPEVGGLSL